MGDNDNPPAAAPTPPTTPDNVVPLGTVVTAGFGGAPYREIGEMADEIKDVILSRSARVPFAAVIGVLHMLAHEFMQDEMG